MADTAKGFSDMPGPYGWPLVGSAFSLLSFPSRVLMQWADEYYGKVFRYRMLSVNCVALNGYDAIKEGLVTNRSKLSGRMTNPFLKAVRNNKGLFFLDHGDLWTKWRPLVVRAVSSVMPDLLDKISDQAEKFLDDITLGVPEGSPINMKMHLRYRLAQVAIISFLNKEHDNIKKDELNEVIDNIYAPFSNKKFVLGLFAPVLAYFPPFSGFIASESKRRERLIQKLVRWIEEHHAETKTRFGSKDITAIFFEDNPDPNSEDLEQLATILMDWIFAGSTTVTEEISWVILFLLKHPDMLERVQNELHEAMRSVSSVVELYQSQKKVPLLNAVIQEGLRLRPIAPGSLNHKTVSEVVVGGYKIPKDIIVVPNLWSVHHDPKIWGPDPDDYRPDRHLDQDGNFQQSDYVIPFSLGNRSCAGEKIGRAEFFIFVASLLLRYNIRLAEESKDVDMDGVSKAIQKTNEHEVILKNRKSRKGRKHSK